MTPLHFKIYVYSKLIINIIRRERKACSSAIPSVIVLAERYGHRLDTAVRPGHSLPHSRTDMSGPAADSTIRSQTFHCFEESLQTTSSCVNSLSNVPKLKGED